MYTIVKDIYNSTIFSDIVKRNQIRKIDQLERVVKYTFQNVGNTFSAKSISDYLKAEHRKLDNESVSSYLENIVYLELCRRGYTVHIGKMDDGEVDFVASKQNDKIYVQVTQEIQTEKTEKREYNRLLRIKDNYPKYVLRTDAFAAGNYQGVKTMHIADFLLSEDF